MDKTLVSIVAALWLTSCSSSVYTPPSWDATPEREALLSKHWQCIDQNLPQDDGVSPVSEVATALDGYCGFTRNAVIDSLYGDRAEMMKRLHARTMSKVLEYRESLRFQKRMG